MRTPVFDMLPPDLITQIFVKLPVQTLLCCKSVSKPWLSLISTPDFINSHINHNKGAEQAKSIPRHNMNFDGVLSVSIGFGFDPIGNDYKVVAMVSFKSKPSTAEVYSANADVWRKVDPNPVDTPSGYTFDVCVSGFLCCKGLNGMMAFDLNKEVFTCGIKLPEMYWPNRITDFNDCIAVISPKENKLNTVFNLWMLDGEACLRDSGVEASWTLMRSIDVGLPVRCVFSYFSSSDLLLRTEDDVWLLYNSDKKEAKNVPVSLDDRRTLKYNESLVSITGFKQAL